CVFIICNYTRRRFGGRQPLCGTGVTSLIDVISNPADCNARIADSRPAPGPFTVTSTVLRPCSIAALEAVSEAICAANEVDFLEHLNPNAPDVDQESAFPKSSVIVTIVFLNIELMCSIPDSTFFFTLRLRDVLDFLRAIYNTPPFLFNYFFLFAIVF